MARRRAPTPGAQWGIVVEMQPAEKIAIYNRRKTDEEKHLAMSKVSLVAERLCALENVQLVAVTGRGLFLYMIHPVLVREVEAVFCVLESWTPVLSCRMPATVAVDTFLLAEK